jgi:hypothetical protein
MDKTPSIEPEGVEEKPERVPVAHTYEDDIARAMDTTDASVIQELLENAREREAVMHDETVNQKQRGWYTAGAIILIVLALGAIGYGIYHYTNLTVPAQKTLSVGVFPSTEIIIADTTDVREVVKKLIALDTLPEQKPHLVSLVGNEKTLTLLSTNEFFSFVESAASEPFIASLDTVRLGVVNTGKEVVPFVIASIPDPEIASKEFLIAEPKLLQMFYKVLGIDISHHLQEIGKGFTSEYMYNLSVRTLRYIDSESNQQRTLLLYAYTTDNTVVVTTKPEVLKAIYDTIIRQR